MTKAMRSAILTTLLLLTSLPAAVSAQTTPNCGSCAVWNTSQTPFRLFGNTWYVGPHGLSSILITSPAGHILIDGDLAESAPLIAANIVALGFRIQDVKLILSSHVHFDHAGGIAQLQRLSGARVLASPWSAAVLTAGAVAKDDPQLGIIQPVAPVPHVETLRDGQTLTLGPLALTAQFTPGHTPGGTSWTWTSCEAAQCLHLVYADSVSSISAPDFRYTGHPQLLQGFEKSFTFLETTSCDILLTPHPDASDLWQRLAAHLGQPLTAEPGACKALAQSARKQLQQRIVTEAKP